MKNKFLYNRLVEFFQLVIELNRKEFEKKYDDLNITEVHIIDFIKKNSENKAILISKYMNLSRAAISKNLKKLKKEGYIDEYFLKTNKKEKYFTLTKKGENIYIKHLENHKQAEEKDSKIFEKFSDDEKKVIIKFLDIMVEDIKKR